MAAYPHAGYYQPEQFPNQRNELTPGDLIGFFLEGTNTLAGLWEDRDYIVAAANPFTLDEFGNSPPLFGVPAIYDARRYKNGVPFGPVVKVEIEVDSADAVDEPGTEIQRTFAFFVS